MPASKLTDQYFNPLADNAAGTGAIALLLGVEDGAAESPAETTRADANGRLKLDDDKPFRSTCGDASCSDRAVFQHRDWQVSGCVGSGCPDDALAGRNPAGESGFLVPRRLACGHHQSRTQGGTGSQTALERDFGYRLM